MNQINKIRELCMSYTSLTFSDMDLIEEQSAMLQTIADIAQANVFIDCLMNNSQHALVVAEAVPSTTTSLYQESVVGTVIYEACEPAVFRSFRSGKPVMIHRAVTHEGKHVNQNVLPIINPQGQVIGTLILEKDISVQVKHEKEIAILSKTTQEFSKTFWDLITNTPSIPDVLEEALLLLREDGAILYANNYAIGLIQSYSTIGEEYTNKHINEVFPFIHEEYYQKKRVAQYEVNYKGKTFSLRFFNLNTREKVERVLLYIKDITDLRDKERQLMVKSAVIKEIHHRVKNNLQTVASLLHLQMRRGLPEDSKKLFQESLNRILSIATVHEYLSYSGIDLVDMEEIIPKISKMLSYNNEHEELQLSIHYDIQPIKLSAKQAVSIAIILAELLQNSMKHGFVYVREGVITVQFQEQEQHIVLSVQDNGLGIQEEFDHDRLGLEIVRNLTQYDLAGTFEIFPHKEGGTLARIIFPKEEEEYESSSDYDSG